MLKTALALALLLLPGTTTSARAQADSLPHLLESLADGARVRVELRGVEEPMTGTLELRAEREVLLKSPAGSHALEPRRLQRLWSEDGHLGGRGALIGGLAGAAATGIAVTILLTPDEDEATPPVSPATAGAVSAVPGGLVGAFFGYLIGRRSTRWKLRFTADRTELGFRVEASIR